MALLTLTIADNVTASETEDSCTESDARNVTAVLFDVLEFFHVRLFWQHSSQWIRPVVQS